MFPKSSHELCAYRCSGYMCVQGSERLQRSEAKAETDRETEISRDSGLMCV